MKNIRKLSPVPYGTVLKHYNTTWNFLNKLSLKQKVKFKQKNRLFSLELGRSLPKRVIWQVALAKDANLLFSKSQLNGAGELTTPSYSWSVFRSALFGKMWLLNNASAVPGIVWPTKSKKLLLAKMKAFKALSLSAGKLKTSFLIKNLQKVYADSFLNKTESTLWKMASSLDSLKNTFYYKAGLFPTIPTAYQKVRSGNVLLNGFSHKKNHSFAYPGDFNTMKETNRFFADLFSVGKTHLSTSLYAIKPFLWLSSFYKPISHSPKNKKSLSNNKKTRISFFFHLIFLGV